MSTQCSPITPARPLRITADGGGGNRHRSRWWKVALQAWADDLDLPRTGSHFPPGTSQWNKMEHRLFCFMTQNWRGKPLLRHQTIVHLMGRMTPEPGLPVRAALDTNPYETGIQVSDAELAPIKLTPHAFHGEWNYQVRPRK